MTDKEIDFIATGMRNAAGGIYASSVYEFARAIIAIERERCANIADEYAHKSMAAHVIADGIRSQP